MNLPDKYERALRVIALAKEALNSCQWDCDDGQQYDGWKVNEALSAILAFENEVIK